MSSRFLEKQAARSFASYVDEGIACFQAGHPRMTIVPSHICFKFSSLAAYADGVVAARALGDVTWSDVNGRQIAWCRLREPLQAGGLWLKWLEMVEPRLEKNAFDGVTGIVYWAPGLETVEKRVSADGKMAFRYQSRDATMLAPS